MVIRLSLLLLLFCSFYTHGYAADNSNIETAFSVACDLAGRGELERKAAVQSIVHAGSANEDYFISMLDSTHTVERQVAAEILGGIGRGRAEASLIAALGSKDVFLQGAAARALAVLYSRLPQEMLVHRLRSTDKVMVSMAVLYGAYKRARYKQEILEPELLKAVSDLLLVTSDDTEIQAAVTVLKFANTQEAVVALLKVVESSNNIAIQIEVCRALAEIAPEGRAPQIEALAVSGKPLLEVHAWNALAAMGYKDADKALSGLALNPDPRVQVVAIRSLVGFGGRYDPIFSGALKSADSDVRLVALNALLKTASVHSAPAVAELMGPQGDADPVVRARAALVFAKLTNAGGLAPLLKDARNENDNMQEFRLEAIRALGKLGDTGALRVLLDSLDDDDIAVRLTAARSLGDLRDRRALPKLEKLLGASSGEQKAVIQEVIADISAVK